MSPRIHHRLGSITAALLLVGSAYPAPVEMGGGPARFEHTCVTAADRARAERKVARYVRQYGPLSHADSIYRAPPLYKFFPMAGQLYRDLFPTDFVDLEPGQVWQDFRCGVLTFDNHDGIDVSIRGFGEQVVGVPVLAVADGTVIATHDGEFDMNTDGDFASSNFVMIDHGLGRVTEYWHLKRWSVTVRAGDEVRAGFQIGAVGASGPSHWPHLHFETRDGALATEPFAGACRPGASGWVDQPKVRGDLYLRDLSFTRSSIALLGGLPHDMPRDGMVVRGSQRLSHWVDLHNLPADSILRIRYRRPDGSIGADTGTLSFGNNPPRAEAWWWWRVFVNFDQLGTWTMLMEINGNRVATAPLMVVDSEAEIANRPPFGIRVSVEPHRFTPDDTLFCKVRTDLLLDDPDYDIVRYKYRWTVNDVDVRSIVSAAHSDALPHHSFAEGDTVRCVVTASDGELQTDPVSSCPHDEVGCRAAALELEPTR